MYTSTANVLGSTSSALESSPYASTMAVPASGYGKMEDVYASPPAAVEANGIVYSKLPGDGAPAAKAPSSKSVAGGGGLVYSPLP